MLPSNLFTETKMNAKNTEIWRKKKPFRKRKRYAKKDHKRYIDYAVDEHGTFRDESHRDGKLFRQRFCHSLQSVHDIAQKISEKEHRFWRVKKSPEG